MPKDDRLLAPTSLTLASLDLDPSNTGRSTGRTHTSAALCANVHVAFSQAKERGSPHVGGPMPAHCARFPARYLGWVTCTVCCPSMGPI